MKINEKFIDKIFNLEIKIKKEKDKIKLSKYEELIPMYDIRSERVYPINKQNLYNRLTISDYRFVNDEIYEWLLNLYKKYKDNIDKGPIYKKNIEIIKNYNINTLLETSYTVLYKYSAYLGLKISICKRNSFNKYMEHLNPYYSKLELIKLGQNMNLIKYKLSLEDLLNKELHYNICLKISHNDISVEELEEHHEYIYNSNILSWICYYSFTGSYIFNDYLRHNNYINKFLYDGIYKIIKVMENSPKLHKSYNIYRFIWDDSYIKNLKIGDIYIDKGFISTTRDPFYTPGFLGHFGLILIKINIPNNIKGLGLFIENFSLFPKEEEFLLPPFIKLKLISKDNNFKYYHTNEKFEEIINKKYEFNIVGVDYKSIYKLLSNNKIYNNYNYININNINFTRSNNKIQMIKKFIELYSNENTISIIINDNKYNFFYQWFNSSENSVYERFYFNKTEEGLLISLFDNDSGYPYINIELAEFICVNYINKFYFGLSNIKLNLDIIYKIAKLFSYNKIIICHEFSSFIIFKNNYSNVSNTYLLSKFFNKTIYDYLKYGIKLYNNNNNIEYDIGYLYLDNFFNKKISINLTQHLPFELKNFKTNKELFINVIEKYFYYYNTLIYLFDNKIFYNEYFTYNINKRYKNEIINPIKDNNLIFRNSILRKN